MRPPERDVCASVDGLAVTTMAAGHRMVLDVRAPAQREAYATGRFDDDLLVAVCGLVGTGPATLVDAGANVGLWTVPLARHAAAAGGAVVAFEPLAANVARLRDNVELNGLADVVTVHELGLSSRRGRCRLTLREDFAAGATTGNAAIAIDDGQDDGFPVEEVDVAPLDELAPSFPGRVALVKMDVEGHEDRVLEGARRTLRRDRPTIVLEWNPVYYERRGTGPTRRLEAAVAGLGYRALRRAGRRWRAEPRIESPKDLDNLVLVPGEELAMARRTLDRLAASTAATAEGLSR